VRSDSTIFVDSLSHFPLDHQHQQSSGGNSSASQFESIDYAAATVVSSRSISHHSLRVYNFRGWRRHVLLGAPEHVWRMNRYEGSKMQFIESCTPYFCLLFILSLHAYILTFMSSHVSRLLSLSLLSSPLFISTQAAALIANLCEVDEHRVPLVHELHVVPALVALAREKARDARFDAARALSYLACCEDNHVLLYDQVSALFLFF
jgi:hypothetical protein